MRRTLFIFSILLIFGPLAYGLGEGLEGQGSWVTKTAAPSKRTEVVAAAVNGRIYVIGGFGMLGVTGTVEQYDPQTDRWQETASLPVSLHHAGAGAVNGKIYVVGGFRGTFSWTPVNTIWEYDPAKDQWRSLRSMPTPRGALAVGVYKGKLYAVGGMGAGDGKGKDQNIGMNESYDPASDAWQSHAPLPTPRDHLAAVVVGDVLYAIGGRRNLSYSDNLAVSEAYDFKTEKWISKAPMPTPRSGITGAVLKGRVHVFGGESPGGTFHEHEVYDPMTDSWKTFPPMPTARHGLGSAVVGDEVYVLDGGTKPGGSFSNLNEVFSLR